ncbi:MAG: DUF4235 domain-containing protein [Marmoricola sp.]
MARKKKDAQQAPKAAEPENPQPEKSRVWTVFALVSSLLGAQVAKKTLTTSWKAATGKHPPSNPADPDVAIFEAVSWAAASGTIVALTRMAFQRRAANYYTKSTGHLPPGLGKDADEASDKA